MGQVNILAGQVQGVRALIHLTSNKTALKADLAAAQSRDSAYQTQLAASTTTPPTASPPDADQIKQHYKDKYTMDHIDAAIKEQNIWAGKAAAGAAASATTATAQMLQASALRDSANSDRQNAAILQNGSGPGGGFHSVRSLGGTGSRCSGTADGSVSGLCALAYGQ